MARHEEDRIGDDKYARQSFTWRRMKGWQAWAISIASAVILVALILYTVL